MYGPGPGPVRSRSAHSQYSRPVGRYRHHSHNYGSSPPHPAWKNDYDLITQSADNNTLLPDYYWDNQTSPRYQGGL